MMLERENAREKYRECDTGKDGCREGRVKDEPRSGPGWREWVMEYLTEDEEEADGKISRDGMRKRRGDGEAYERVEGGFEEQLTLS
jgi:hypothetical protein